MRFNEKRFAVEYEERLSREGYPGELFNAVANELYGQDIVIDIGAGSGFLSIPLARSGHRILAVEPSNEMISLFMEKITVSLQQKITIVNSQWEDWEGPQADASICVHSIYPMSDFAKAIRMMNKYSKVSVLVVRDELETKTLSDEIRTNLNIGRGTRNVPNIISEILEGEGISYNTKQITDERTQKFNDITSEAEYYCYHLKLDDTFKSEIIQILENTATFKNGTYFYSSTYSDTMFIF